MTWLEIVDTAIKIGLGAFLGGISAYILNKQTHTHEFTKEVFLDNRRTLKDVSAKFENIHASVISLSLEMLREWDLYSRQSKLYEDTSKSDESSVIDEKPKKPDFYNRRYDRFEKLLLELYELQGVLMLYGYENMSSVIYKYTSNVSTISPRNKKGNSGDDLLEPEGIEKFNELRNRFYDAAHDYLMNNRK